MKRFLLLTVCCLTALGCWAQEEGYTYEGKVIDQDRNPIEGAIVTCSGYTTTTQIPSLTDTTDANGKFEIKLPVNSKFDLYGCDITATAQGHTPFSYTGALPDGLNIVLYNTLKYQEGQLYSIVLPTTPDTSKGRYFRLDRKEGTSLIFERELSPKANVPYAFIPNCDFQISIADLDLTQQITDTKIYGNQKMGITFKGSYASTKYSINGNAVSSNVDNVLTETDEDIHPWIEAMHATVIYHWMEFEDAPKGQPELVIHDIEEAYVPFVSKLKQWHVLGFCEGPLSSADDYTFAETEVEKDGKNYLPLLKNWKRHDGNVKPDTCGLFREEGQRVYLYNTAKKQEYCIYDFTLEVGDTFEVRRWDGPAQAVVTQRNKISAGKNILDEIVYKYTDIPEDDPLQEYYGGSWIEGIGGYEGPMGWGGQRGEAKSWSYEVAYAVQFDEFYMSQFFPFQICDMWGGNNWVIGHELTKGKEMDPDLWYKMVTERTPMLRYEIVDSQIHVTGYMDLNCGADLYAYCKVSPYEGSLNKYQISVETEETGNVTTCDAYYSVELYFDLPRAFDDGNYEFVAIDDDGEHAVPQRSSDYRPFVSKLKQWHVLGFSVGPLSSVDDYTFAETEVEKDGKNYLPLLKNWERYDGNVKPDTCGLFREEGRRVYLYDQGTEYCIYDFTLEVGDTFDISWGTEADRCVVTEVGEMAVKDRHLRTITFSSVDAARGGKGFHQNHTWIEGIGDRSRPDYGWVSNYVPSSWTYDVAYVLTDYREGDINGFYPFNVCSLWGTANWVIGQELAKGEQCTSEPEGYRERASLLDYEIVGNRLHVSGYADISSGPNNYIYCKVSPYNGSPDTYQITLKEEEVAPKQDGFTINSVDWNFEAPIFGEPYKFIAIDNDGEHAVPQRSHRPFVEDGKVWKVGLFESEALNAYQLQYYYFENDTTIEDLMQKNLTGKKLMRRTEDEDTRKTEYVATIREEDRHVYHVCPNDFVWKMTYDFASEPKEVVFFGSPAYPHTEFWGTIDSKSFIEDACYKGFATKVCIKDLGGEQVEWLEAVGTRISPVNNIGRLLPGIEAEALLSCTVGNDTLFHNPRYTEEISTVWEGEDEAEVKKEKIDFTHVVKTKPTVPRKVAANEAQEAKVGAEVSELSLDITFSGLSGPYTVSLRNEADEQVFAQRMETDNLRSLDVRLADYEAGRYTVAVENDQEAYFASFQFEGSAIRPVGNDATDAPLYDLTGRRLSHRPARGIYLQGGRKRVVR